jgi:hypothetical protein
VISKKTFELKILQMPYIMSISLWYSAVALLSVGFAIPDCRVRLLPGREARIRMKISVINLRLAAA